MIETAHCIARSLNPNSGGYLLLDDLDDRLIKVSGSGFVEPWQLDEIFEKTGRLIENCRLTGRPVRMLVDNRRIMIHGPESAERLRVGATRHQPEDRVAIIVESSLARLQLRRILDMRIHNLFLSEDEAVRWLFDQ